jgi:uncharacterized membrane protein YciS (DUF1049 family)
MGITFNFLTFSGQKRIPALLKFLYEKQAVGWVVSADAVLVKVQTTSVTTMENCPQFQTVMSAVWVVLISLVQKS